MQATRTTVVQAPVDTVWSVLADHEGMAEWGPGMSATLVTPGSGDRNGVGAVRRLKARGPAPAIVEEIVAFDPPRRLEYRARSGVPLKNYGGTVELRPVDSGTEIKYTISADQRVPLVEGVVVKALAAGLSALLVRQVRKVAAG